MMTIVMTFELESDVEFDHEELMDHMASEMSAFDAFEEIGVTCTKLIESVTTES